jgi:hypothetical protein
MLDEFSRDNYVKSVFERQILRVGNFESVPMLNGLFDPVIENVNPKASSRFAFDDGVQPRVVRQLLLKGVMVHAAQIKHVLAGYVP